MLLTENIEAAQASLKLGQIGLTITTERFFGFIHLRRHIPAEREVDADALLDCELLGGPALLSRDVIPAFV